MKVTGKLYGSTSTTIYVAEFSASSLDSWYGELTVAIHALAHAKYFEVSLPIDGDYVTSGVNCAYRGGTFEIWSDRPGEVVVRFRSLRPRVADELVTALADVWASAVV
jgi:hypothetical protein